MRFQIMNIPWKKISSEIVHSNRWYHVRCDKVIQPNGEQGEYNVVVREPAVFIVALTENQEVVLINLYRYPTSTWSLEVPAGGSEGEGLLEAAQRELREETGFIAKSWKNIGEYQVFNGLTDELGYVFLAQDLRQTGDNNQHEEGINAMQMVPLKEALHMIADGRIKDAQTIVALSYARAELGV